MAPKDFGKCAGGQNNQQDSRDGKRSYHKRSYGKFNSSGGSRNVRRGGEARKQRREKVITKAEREKKWQATKVKITDQFKEIVQNPAMMLQLPSMLCRLFGAAAIISPRKAVDEGELEADTDTDDEKIRRTGVNSTFRATRRSYPTMQSYITGREN